MFYVGVVVLTLMKGDEGVKTREELAYLALLGITRNIDIRFVDDCFGKAWESS